MEGGQVQTNTDALAYRGWMQEGTAPRQVQCSLLTSPFIELGKIHPAESTALAPFSDLHRVTLHAAFRLGQREAGELCASLLITA
jgi:hypothetical protein